MNILFLSSEAVPFAKTGGLGDVAGVLPKVMAGSESVSLMMPDYMTEAIERLDAFAADEFSLWLGTKEYPVTIKSAVLSPGFSVHFVANAGLFGRGSLYGDDAGDYPDNFARFYVFQKAVLEFVRRSGLRFDIIHCNDWQTAMIPLFLRAGSPAPQFQGTRIVFSIHNLGYQGVFPGDCFWETGLPAHLFSPDFLEFYGKLNCMKAGIIFSDRVVTVSPTYAKEILTKEKGFGLDGLLRKHSRKLSGILNGVDYGRWDPRVDPLIGHRYSASSLEGKRKNKQDLFARLGIRRSVTVPLLVMISRISEQKGMELLLDLLPPLLRDEVHFIFLGVGDPAWTARLQATADRFPERMTFLNRFDEEMAHWLEAAADIFFMPSVYEPCGLNQIYSMRYGTVPVVRATGGLEDSVEDFLPESGRGTGFKFRSGRADEALDVLHKALRLFADRAAWRGLQRNGMEMDFSWERVAPEYLDLYQIMAREEIQHG